MRLSQQYTVLLPRVQIRLALYCFLSLFVEAVGEENDDDDAVGGNFVEELLGFEDDDRDDGYGQDIWSLFYDFYEGYICVTIFFI